MTIMRIINLTQHVATPEQVAAGVVEPADKKAVQALLTFDEPPTKAEIMRRARILANMAAEYGQYDAAMIGGAGYLVTRLENALDVLGIHVKHSFTRRETVEETLPDGSVKKVAVFRHVGWAPADE